MKEKPIQSVQVMIKTEQDRIAKTLGGKAERKGTNGEKGKELNPSSDKESVVAVAPWKQKLQKNPGLKCILSGFTSDY